MIHFCLFQVKKCKTKLSQSLIIKLNQIISRLYNWFHPIVPFDNLMEWHRIDTHAMEWLFLAAMNVFLKWFGKLNCRPIFLNLLKWIVPFCWNTQWTPYVCFEKKNMRLPYLQLRSCQSENYIKESVDCIIDFIQLFFLTPQWNNSE